MINRDGVYNQGDQGELVRLVKETESLLALEREVNEQLRDNEKIYRSLLETSPDAIIISDINDRIIMANHQAAVIYGTENKDFLVGKNSIDFFVPEDRERARKDFGMILQNGSTKIARYSILKAESTPCQVEINTSLILGRRGRPKALVSIYRDISGHMSAQKERELASLDRFNLVGQVAAGIGHEIRNPMTTVRGLLQVLKGKKGCRHFMEYYDIMIAELDRANSIITEFLTVAVSKPADLKWTNLNNIIRLLYPRMIGEAVHSGKSITLITGQIPDLELNEKEIMQLIFNLVRNGLEAMEPGGELTIRTYSERGGVALTVKDQGKGIEPELIDKIGTPFFTTKEMGTGLGLAVCHGVAARHGAVIGVETGSAGTTFLVHFKNEGTGPC
ncbi:MAG TPA: PAS domain-containing sensor histidine kinase [Desulfotomaculum sp.]|nr:PAS domain-containing sensor histidine kinase [Desulfotomaculum sp.]